MMKGKIGYNVPAGQRYVMMLCSSILCFFIAAFIMALIQHGGISQAKMRIAMVVQDVVMFILPAIATAVVVSRRPGDFLMITKRPGLDNIVLVLLILLASVPLMNGIIALNKNLVLPDSLSSLQQWMEASENAANAGLKLVIGDGGIGSLIMGLLIIGVMAGFSEELFFRGALQRIIRSTPVSGHVAVWVSAIIFSAAHMQFFGFVPRLLLGAFFGYAAWWSGSVWLAVAAHVMNNSLAFILMWLKAGSNGAIDPEQMLTPNLTMEDLPMIAISAILTAIGITLLYKRLHKRQ